MNRLKTIILGITLYFSTNLFFKIGVRWFDELNNRAHWEDRAIIMKKQLWKAFLINSIVVCSAVTILIFYRNATIDEALTLRTVAIILALTASSGRSGWEIQSVGGKTIVERIDKGMFRISQLSATVILLFVLTM